MRIILILAIVLGTMIDSLLASPQQPEIIIHNGETNRLFSLPLDSFIKSQGEGSILPLLILAPRTSANWRGYQGEWLIRENRFYLKRVTSGDTDITASFFNNKERPILATWYTEDLVIPQGEQVQYEHSGWGGSRERYLFFMSNQA